MYLNIIFLPLLGSFCAGFLGYRLGIKGSVYITIICMLLNTFFSYVAFYEVGLCGSICQITIFEWLTLGSLNVKWTFFFDSITVVMLIVINTVSTIVHIYSKEYMSGDPHVPRFMSYLSLFTFFMIMLVTSDNFLQLFFGWEGVGLCSYLLINFWYTRLSANKSAIKAMIVNRIGDFGLTLGILLIYLVFCTIDFFTIFSLAPYYIYQSIIFFNYEFNVLTLICICLFIGAVGKSAQIGFHTWLPDAM